MIYVLLKTLCAMQCYVIVEREKEDSEEWKVLGKGLTS